MNQTRHYVKFGCKNTYAFINIKYFDLYMSINPLLTFIYPPVAIQWNIIVRYYSK